MKWTHTMVGAGIAAVAATGFAPVAMAAPGQTVTTEECEASGNRVGSADDGVGTCMGGFSPNDGILVDDTTGTSGTAREGDGGSTTADDDARTSESRTDDEFPFDEVEDEDDVTTEDRTAEDRTTGDRTTGDRTTGDRDERTTTAGGPTVVDADERESSRAV